MPQPSPPDSWLGRLLWFAGLWLAGVATLALTAFLLRSALF